MIGSMVRSIVGTGAAATCNLGAAGATTGAWAEVSDKDPRIASNITGNPGRVARKYRDGNAIIGFLND